MNIFFVLLVSALLMTDSDELATALAIEHQLVLPSDPSDIEEASQAKYNQLKTKFEEDLVKILSTNKCSKHFKMTIDDPIEKRAINRVQIEFLIDILLNKKNNVKNYYNYRKTFFVMTINDVNYLYSITEKEKEKNPNGGRIVALEDMFDICYSIHKAVGYQGRDGMLNEAEKFYGNITRPIVELFLNYSEEYNLKKKKLKNHGLVVKPIRSSDFNSRWQIDLIDFRTLPDGEYNWIMTVQDHCTKFVWLIPLKNKSGSEVARGLFELFGIFGAPQIFLIHQFILVPFKVIVLEKLLNPKIYENFTFFYIS